MKSINHLILPVLHEKEERKRTNSITSHLLHKFHVVSSGNSLVYALTNGEASNNREAIFCWLNTLENISGIPIYEIENQLKAKLLQGFM